MRGLIPTNLSRVPPPRVGPKTVAIPISFDPVDTDANNTFRFDLTQEMFSGQLATPQCLYLDNTAGAVDIQMLFGSSNQIVRFPVRSLALLPYLAQDFGPVQVRYQSSDWYNFPGFPDVNYKPTLYVMNVAQPYGVWWKPNPFEGCSVGNYSGACTGGLASDMVFDSVNLGVVPETRLRVYLENPASEIEPLFWRMGGTASGTRARLMPGEHIVLGEGTTISQGSLQVAAVTAGHTYKCYLWSLL